MCTFCKDIFFLEIGYIRVIWAEDFIFHTFNAFFKLHIYLFLQNKIQIQLLLPKLPRIGWKYQKIWTQHPKLPLEWLNPPELWLLLSKLEESTKPFLRAMLTKCTVFMRFPYNLVMPEVVATPTLHIWQCSTHFAEDFGASLVIIAYYSEKLWVTINSNI